MGESERLTELCLAAGITRATVIRQQGRGRFPSIRSMVEVDLRGWLPLPGVVLEEGLIAEILRQAEVALRPFVVDDGGGVAFASPALLATAVKPTAPR